jgi:aryl-alcohol dehydrogenase-like predicted oxidoreductase
LQTFCRAGRAWSAACLRSSGDGISVAEKDDRRLDFGTAQADPRAMLAGCATAEGTARFRDASGAARGHFRESLGVSLSSLGIGTYLGRDDTATDALYARSVRCALQLGINVVDSAINYRNQRSERAVGVALRESGVPRDQIILCTKGGYLPFDGGRPHDVHAYLEETFINPGILRADEIVGGCHSLAPRFLDDQVERSRRNLGVSCIDLYYLHNPETQLREVSRAWFKRRLRAAFEALHRRLRHCDVERLSPPG